MKHQCIKCAAYDQIKMPAFEKYDEKLRCYTYHCERGHKSLMAGREVCDRIDEEDEPYSEEFIKYLQFKTDEALIK